MIGGRGGGAEEVSPRMEGGPGAETGGAGRGAALLLAPLLAPAPAEPP